VHFSSHFTKKYIVNFLFHRDVQTKNTQYELDHNQMKTKNLVAFIEFLVIGIFLGKM